MAVPKVTATRGKPYKRAAEGWSLRLPRRWRVRAAEGMPITLDLRRSRVGRIFVRFRPGITYQNLREVKRRYVRRDNIRFKGALGHLRTWNTYKYRVVENNRVAVGRRVYNQPALSLSVVGPRGVLTLIGYTTRSRIAALRALLRGMAKTVAFFTP